MLLILAHDAWAVLALLLAALSVALLAAAGLRRALAPENRPSDSAAQPVGEPSVEVLPSCPNCGLKLMKTMLDGHRLRLLCAACEVAYVAEEEGTSLDRFPAGFRPEADFKAGPDPGHEGTFFGI